jgi:CTP:molybdopterin cytidylyltransferase MocA
VQKLSPDETLREVLNDQSDHITYVMVETPSVLSDLDTPEAYQRQRPVDEK